MAIVAGRFERLLELRDLVDRIAQRNARREVERDRHRRLLALVVDLQRTDRRHQLGHRRQRNGHVVRRLHVELGQIGRIDAELRLHFQDDLVVVRRHVDGADLARAVGVVELVADLIDGDAVDRGLLAVDIDRHLRILDVEVGGDVEQARQLGDLVAHLGRQRDTAIRYRRSAACTDTGSCDGRPPIFRFWMLWKNACMPGTCVAFWRSRPMTTGAGSRSLLRLQRDEQPAVIRGRIGSAGRRRWS